MPDVGIADPHGLFPCVPAGFARFLVTGSRHRLLIRARTVTAVGPVGVDDSVVHCGEETYYVLGVPESVAADLQRAIDRLRE